MGDEITYGLALTRIQESKVNAQFVNVSDVQFVKGGSFFVFGDGFGL